MEISRRHLQDTERAELRDVLIIGAGGSSDNSVLGRLLEQDQHDAELKRMKDQMVEMSGGAVKRDSIQVHTAESQERAAEMQRQVDGLTRNQRRVLNKRMRKAAKK